MKLNLNLAQIHLQQTQNSSYRSLSTARNPKRKQIPLDTLQNCLDSLDLFKDLLQGIPHMRNRVIRDVRKAIQAERYQQNDVIYDINQKATAVYFCLKGSISISILSEKTARSQSNAQHRITSAREQQKIEPQYVQINVVEQGQGFGQAQFIAQTKRTVRAVVKSNDSFIGKLELQSVAEVLQNYKMRVYYKKRDMFTKCPLFQNLNQQKLEFIINNTKIMTINMSHKLTEEGGPANMFYLVNKGKMKIWRNNPDRDSRLQYSSSSKYMRDNKKKIEKKIMGELIQQGHFIGDIQIALKRPHIYTTEAITQKVELYYCDKRIVLSQMTDEDITDAEIYYLQKQETFKEKVKKFNKISHQLSIQKEKDLQIPLTLDQIKLKRKLLRRHMQTKPSLIGSSSPRDIAKMIARKRARITEELVTQKLPVIELFPSHSMKKRAYQKNSFSPIPMVHTPIKRSKTQFSPSSFNPEEEDSPYLPKAKSMMVQVKNKKSLKLNKITKYKQQNMAVVGKVLGRYNKMNGIYSLNQIIQSIKNKKY